MSLQLQIYIFILIQISIKQLNVYFRQHIRQVITSHIFNKTLTALQIYNKLHNMSFSTSAVVSTEVVPRATTTSVCCIICAEVVAVDADTQITFTDKSQWRIS